MAAALVPVGAHRRLGVRDERRAGRDESPGRRSQALRRRPRIAGCGVQARHESTAELPHRRERTHFTTIVPRLDRSPRWTTVQKGTNRHATTVCRSWSSPLNCANVVGPRACRRGAERCVEGHRFAVIAHADSVRERLCRLVASREQKRGNGARAQGANRAHQMRPGSEGAWVVAAARAPCDLSPVLAIATCRLGQVAERLNAPVLKTGGPSRVSWVRIPPCPLSLDARHRMVTGVASFGRSASRTQAASS